MRIKKILAGIMAAALMAVCGSTAVLTNEKLTVWADETEEGNENEVPAPEEPEEPGETPEEPSGEEPSEGEGDPGEEPTEDGTDAPSEGEEPDSTEPTADSTEDEEDGGSDEPEENDGGDTNGGGAVTSRRKVTTKVSKTSETTAGGTKESVTAASAAAETGAAPARKDDNGGSVSVTGIAVIVVAAAAVAAGIFAAVRSTSKGGIKEVYDPGMELDENNCPFGAGEFNENYGRYNACAVTEYENRIILTFEPEYDMNVITKILDVLKEKNVSGLFFINGVCLDEQPELISRIISDGHMLGNSGMTDASMPDMSGKELKDSIIELHERLWEENGYEMRYFRPPYGEFSKKTLGIAKDCGYKTLMWSYEYIEFPGKAEAVEDIVECAHSGGIYLFRYIKETDADVLSEAIDILRDKGYVF